MESYEVVVKKWYAWNQGFKGYRVDDRILGVWGADSGWLKLWEGEDHSGKDGKNWSAISLE